MRIDIQTLHPFQVQKVYSSEVQEYHTDGCAIKFRDEPEKPMYAVGVSVLLTNKKGQLLLAKRKNNSGAGLLSTPGGRIEYNETVERAAYREFAEECGCNLAPVRIIGWRKHNRFNNHYFMFYVHATGWGWQSRDNEIKNCIPDKSEDWAWYNVQELTPGSCTEPQDILDDVMAAHYNAELARRRP